MWPMMSYVRTFCSSRICGHTCKVSPRSVQPLQRKIFLKFFFFKTWLLNHMTDDVIIFFSVDHFIPKWHSKNFILIRCGVLHKQLWHHNEGTYDIIKKITYSPWGVLAMCQVSNFSLVRFQRYRGPKFFRFSNMAATPHDIWCHNYHWNIPHEESHQWWKFRLNPTSGCREKHESSVRKNRQKDK